ncbi:MAG: T9SS type A sorting domain-containing protein, partial [Ignavibacteriales bacterium]|nr:T9SS type A sorting domain-containing protein [Ignavibacteriales bacterium]
SLTYKIDWCKEKGIAGIGIWELWRGWIKSNPPGLQDPLLQAVKKAVGNIWQPPQKSFPKIKGEIFFDKDQNGINNSTDPPMPGWRVTCSGSEGQISTLTDSAGNYYFDSLQIGEHVVTIDIKENWSPTYPLPAGTVSYTISLLADTSIGICDFGFYARNAVGTKLTTGWNAISLPITVSNPHYKNIFPMITSSVFLYHDYYIPEDSLLKGLGYLGKFSNNQIIWTAGTPIDTVTVPLNEGWNIFGSISTPTPVNYARTSPLGISLTPFYSYDKNGYGFTDSIFPGNGYWVKMSQSGSIFLSKNINQIIQKSDYNNLISESFNSLVVKNASGELQKLYFSSNQQFNQAESELFFELPPRFQNDDIFDARFLSLKNPEWKGGIAGIFDGSADNRIPLIISAASYPLNFIYSQNKPDQYKYSIETPDGKFIKLADNVSIEIFKTSNNLLNGSKEFWLVRDKISDKNELPGNFSLKQNFPNPFNSGTVISFILPEDGVVKIELFNILGEKVAVLADGEMSGGEHYLNFGNNQNLASGLYLYKATFTNRSLSSFTQTKRMLLLK